MSLLEVKNLKTYFLGEGQAFPAVDDISFSLDKGKILAIIGESGSGKSVTSLSIMGLVDYPGEIVGGQIIFDQEDLLLKNEKQLRQIRGSDIAMIYQDPMSTLNPMIQVGKQIEEAILIHRKKEFTNKGELRKQVIDLMETVGIPDSFDRYHYLPGQFSGGMRQRLMIAMAIANNPKILIADEPTTALDVTIQAEILDLLRDLKVKKDMAILLNTHDLGVVAEMADEVVVMYCGKIMEITSAQRLFDHPLNPYTEGLIKCIPRIDEQKKRLEIVKGYVPHISQRSKGCRFSDRCAYAFDRCMNDLPELKEVSKGHWSRCWLENR